MDSKEYIKADITPIEDESVESRRSLAKDPDTSERILRKLAEDDDIIVRTYVVLNPSTPTEISDYLKDGHIVRKYCIELIDVYQNWEWDPDDFLQNLDSDYADHFVIFSGDYELTEADWWEDTEEVLTDLLPYYEESNSVHEFITKVNEDYYREVVDYLDDLYDLYERYEGYINSDMVVEAVEWFYPDIEQTRVYGPTGESAYVLYDSSEVSDRQLTELPDWIFGNVYESREYRLDLNDFSNTIREFDSRHLFDMYIDYGYELNSYELFTNTEIQELRAKGVLIPELCRRLGYVEDECEVFAD